MGWWEDTTSWVDKNKYKLGGAALGALIPGGGLVAAGIGFGIGGGMDANGQNEEYIRRANEMALQSAREQMAFQERMSSTSYQRAVQDLSASGLNQMMALPNGASTPGGASAPVQAAHAENVGEGAAGTAIQAMQLKQSMEKQGHEIALLESQRKATDANAAKTGVDTIVASKGIPEAELKMGAYMQLKKAMEANSASAIQRNKQNQFKGKTLIPNRP